MDGHGVGVADFDANKGFTWNWRLDPDVGRRQSEGDVLLQACDGFDAYTHAGLHPELGDAWTENGIINIGIHRKTIEGLLEGVLLGLKRLRFHDHGLAQVCCFKQVDTWTGCRVRCRGCRSVQAEALVRARRAR